MYCRIQQAINRKHLCCEHHSLLLSFECGFRVTCTRCAVFQATQTNQPIKTDAPGNEEKTLDVTGDSHVAAASSQSEEGEETIDSQTSEPSQSADIPVKSCSKQVCRNYTLKSVRACE